MSHKEKISKSGKGVYFAILIAGLLVSAAVLFSLLVGLRINFIFTNLLDSATKVKVNVASARFEFFKSQNDTSKTSLTNAWEFLNLAELYASKLLEEKDQFSIISLSVSDENLKTKVQKLQVDLLEYRGYAAKVDFKSNETDVGWETLFTNIVFETEDIEREIRNILNTETNVFRYSLFGLIALSIVLAFASSFVFYRYEKQRSIFVKKIQDANLDLEKGRHKRTRAEAALLETQRKFQTLIQNLPGMVYRCKSDGDWTMEFVSDKCFNITGFQADEFMDSGNISYSDLIHPTDKPKILHQIQKAVEERKPYHLVYRITTSSGIEKWVWEEGTGIFSEKEDDLIALEGFITDITEQKLIEDRLQLQSNALEAAANGIVITDRNANLIWANSAYWKLTGNSFSDVSLQNLNVFMSDQHDQSYFNDMWAIILRGDVWRGEIMNKKKDGSIYIEEMTVTPIRSAEGEITFFVAIKQDVTERKKADDALRDSEFRFRGLYENATIGIFRTQADGTILMANPTLIKMLGYNSFEDLVAATASDFYVNPSERAAVIKKINSEGKIVGYESRWKTKSGDRIYVRESARLVRDDEGRALYMEGTIEDITEKKKFEEELIVAKERAEQSDKLKSEFLSQMSHEIRTPLNVILSFTSMMKDELQDKVEEDLAKGFDVIDEEGKRIMRTIELIINMSQVQTGSYTYSPQQLDLYKKIINRYYENYVGIANQKKLKFDVINNADPAIIFADEYSVNQIFYHLIDNAVKYTSKGKVEISINKDSRGNIYVDVADTGIGISPEYMPMLFTPFTKEEKGYTRNFEGNGLGLALAKKYCDLNSATIKATSRKGKGSIFRVTFRNKITS